MSRSKRRRAAKPRASQPARVNPLFLGVGGLVAAIALLVVAVLSSQNGGTGSAPAAFTPTYTGGPRVEVAQEVFDYGAVKLNTPVETVFRVRNVGDAPLEILGEPQVRLVEGC